MKSSLRKIQAKMRDHIPESIRETKSNDILKRLKELPQYTTAKCVMVYLSFKSEVATRQIINDLLALNKTVVLPVVDFEKGQLILVTIQSLDTLVRSDYGIYEPEVTDDTTISISDVDLVLAPGLAFDNKGNRLGYGGGYYDRLLSSKARHTCVIGLAFSEQLVESVPHDDYDQVLDYVVCDQEIITCRLASLKL